ncbi:uncharacterized protein LOC124254604 [Haliotis rubra]|uniref:uncharacterized protein LOC124254604 n=1 Tax=Haliotis rubra TaxID=36100 RepID=UPI001EE579EA|nr:uncharacterized protein LOC124254604 [Haliotis rubra]
MKVGGVFIITVLVLCQKSHSIEVSSIHCGDVCSAVDGSSYTLTCKWSGTLGHGIIWKRKGTTEFSCGNTSESCAPGESGYATGGYVDSQTSQIHIASFSNADDVGNWQCSDGPDTPKSCILTPIDKRNIKLEASCSTKTVTCKLDDHGTPAITLELRDETVKASTPSAGILTMSASSGMKTCTVTGNGSECASTKEMTVMCYGTGPPIAAIVMIIICVIIVIVLLVLVKNGSSQMKLFFYAFEVILIIIAVVFIIVLFALYTDFDDALFIVAVVIVFAGLIVAIAAFIILKLLQ